MSRHGGSKSIVLAAVAGTLALTGAQVVLAQGPEAQEEQRTMERQRQAEGEVQRERLVERTATIADIDKENRLVMLKGPEGQEFSILAPERVQLDELKKGDQVDVKYYESLAVKLQETEAGPEAKLEEKSKEVPGRGGMKERELTATVEVISTDAENNTITFKGPKGQERTVRIEDPKMQQLAAGLEQGDKVQITYRQAVAAELRPHGKAMEEPKA